MSKLLIPFYDGIDDEIPPPIPSAVSGSYVYPEKERRVLEFSLENIRDNRILKEIQSSLEEHDRLFTVMESFEKARQITTVAIEEGRSLNVFSAAMLDTMLSRCSKVAGITYTPIKVSLESLDKIGQRHLTKISTESFMDKVISFGKTLAEKIRKLWEKVKAFLRNVFKRDKAIQSQLEKQLSQVSSLPEKSDFPKKLTDSSQVAKEDFGNHHLDVFMDQVPFGINGRCDFETTNTVIENTSTLIRANRGIVLEIVECMKNLTQDKIDYARVLNEVENLVNDIKRNIGQLPLNFKKTVDATVTYSYGHLVSEQSCNIEEQLGRSEDSEKVFNIHVEIRSKGQRTAYIPDTLAKRQMSALIVSAMKLMTQAQELDKVVDIVEKVLQRATSFLTSKLDDQTADDRRNIHLAIRLIKDLFRYISTMLPKISRDASNVSSSVHYYVKSSVGTYMH